MISHFLYYLNESDWIRRVDVAVALAGTVAAAPEATIRLRQQVVDGTRSTLNNVRSVLGRFVPFLPRPVDLRPSGTRVDPQLAAAGAATDSLRVWKDHQSLEDQVEYLGKQLQRAFADIEQVKQEIKDTYTTLMQALEERSTEWRADFHGLRDSLRARRNWEAIVDSRGILVVALGVFLRGIPDELALIPVVGWLVSIAALIWTAFIVRRIFADLL